jgi:hypothetical protein
MKFNQSPVDSFRDSVFWHFYIVLTASFIREKLGLSLWTERKKIEGIWKQSAEKTV